MAEENGTNSELGSEENLTAGTINMDIEELDDAEYASPAVDKLPSLESILAEADSGSFCGTDEDVGNLSVERLTASETLSVGSLLSLSSPCKPRIRQPSHSGVILRHLILKGICTQVTSASEKINAGLASALAAAGNMLSIGTSHGLILNFDSGQTLKWCHRDTKHQGSVSSLCFNNDGSRILAGFAKGNIIMIDSINGKVLRILTDVHPPGTAVLHVKFTDSSKLALCSDSGGSVFELTFTRIMGVRGCDSKCLFSGSRGEVCTLEPLLLNELPSHPLKNYTLVALATLSKVIVVCIRPRMRVVLTHPLSGAPIAPPQVAWQLVVIRSVNGNRIVDPVLALGRDNTIHFYQVCSEAGMRVRLIPLRRIILTYTMSNLRWMNSRSLAVLDVQEKLHLMDVRTQENLETLDVSNVGLSYASSYFKGLSTGGNVSKAMALAGERACYNSMIIFGSQLLLLGTKSLHAVCIRTWTERLCHLTAQKRFQEALVLGLEFYQDKAKAVVGLKGSKVRRKQIVQDKVCQVLIGYMDELTNPSASASDFGENADLDVVSTCVEYCIQLECKDLLFERLWNLVSECDIYRVIYLRALEAPLLDGSLPPHLPPLIAQQLVDLYNQENRLESLQAIIIMLNIACLDIHQVTTVCKSRGLWEALIHLQTSALGDYTAPIHQLVPILQNYLDEVQDTSLLPKVVVSLGNALLVYASCCLMGRQFPRKSDLPEGQPRIVKADMLRALLSQHSSLANESERQYPYLRTLLKFDARGFLDAIGMAFQEPEFTSEMGMRQRQRVVDILFNLVTPNSPLNLDNTDHLSNDQIMFVLIFIVNEVVESTVNIENSALHTIIELLCTDSFGEYKTRRENAILNLMEVGKLDVMPESTLLNLAKRGNFLRIAEQLHTSKGDWNSVCECLIADPARHNEVFLLIQQIPMIQSEQIIKKNCHELLDIDAVALANIIITNFPDQINNVINSFNDSPEKKYALLSVLYKVERENSIEKSKLEKDCDTKNNKIILSQDVLECYLKLMCAYEPTKVKKYLQGSYGCSTSAALNIVRNAKRKDAEALLLERLGDYKSAYEILHNRLKELIDIDDIDTYHVEEATAITLQLSSLCRKAAGTLEWNPFVETVLSLQANNFKTDSKNIGGNLLRIILESLSGSTALSSVLEHILKQPLSTGGTMGDVRQLLTSVLAQTRYEQVLVETTNRLVSLELHEALKKCLKDAAKPYICSSTICLMCQRLLSNSQECIIIFSCNHTYHVECLSEPKMCYKCLKTNGWAHSVTNIVPPSQSSNIKERRKIEPPEFMRKIIPELTLSPPVPWPDLENIL